MRIYKISLFVILIITLIVPSGYSQQVKSIGIQAGTFFQEGDWTTGINSDVCVNINKKGDRFVFQPFAGFKYNSVSKTLDNIDFDLKFSNFVFGINFLYIIKTFSKNDGIYIGPGLSYNVITHDCLNSYSGGGKPELKEISDNKIGFGVLLDYIHNFGKVSALFESKYEYMHGGYNNVNASLGLLINLK